MEWGKENGKEYYLAYFSLLIKRKGYMGMAFIFSLTHFPTLTSLLTVRSLLRIFLLSHSHISPFPKAREGREHRVRVNRAQGSERRKTGKDVIKHEKGYDNEMELATVSRN